MVQRSTFNEAELLRIMQDWDSPIGQALEEAMDWVAMNARALVPERTGDTAKSIHPERGYRADGVIQGQVRARYVTWFLDHRTPPPYTVNRGHRSVRRLHQFLTDPIRVLNSFRAGGG